MNSAEGGWVGGFEKLMVSNGDVAVVEDSSGVSGVWTGAVEAVVRSKLPQSEWRLSEGGGPEKTVKGENKRNLRGHHVTFHRTFFLRKGNTSLMITTHNECAYPVSNDLAKEMDKGSPKDIEGDPKGKRSVQ
ncbi:hypothetical protein EDB85DRAFT_1895683 [Lactarius pseudohatsudake]|nr:hypothetical protein EDB85DRAFT_1895683 [Lactarius pseudohatsudake]